MDLRHTMKANKVDENTLSPQNTLRLLTIVQYLIWFVVGIIILALIAWLGLWVPIIFCILMLIKTILVHIWLYWLTKRSKCFHLIPLKAIKNPKMLGKFSREEIEQLIQETADNMKMKVPKAVFLYPSKLANAFVILRGRKLLALYSNILHILNKEELTAVIGHELAHLKYGCYPFPVLLALLLFTKFDLFFKVLQANEYMADYYSAKYNGLLPMVNSLLKVYSRTQFVVDILDHLEFFKQAYGIPDEADPYLISLVEERLLHIFRGEKPLAYYASEVVQKCIRKRGIGQFMRMRFDQTIKEVQRRHKWKEQYEKINWETFDNHIKDLWIDEVELQEMYCQLKRNEAYRLFIPSSEEKDKNRTHPLLRERIIFLIEALKPERDLC
jgi:Zn-dependent protease with chaperone function